MSFLSLRTRGLAAGVLLAVSLGLPALAETGADRFADTSRIAAVGGSITEIVYALGEENKLVARDSTSVYPDAALKLPDVGYMRALSPEGVLGINPTGILALEGSGPKETIDVLKKASVTYIEVPERFDHQGILDKIRVVGKALSVEDKASALEAKVDADLKAAEAQTAAIPADKRKRVLFILSMQGGKMLASGSGTAADGIIALAGAVNAVQGYQGYKQLTEEAILEARPDLVLMMDRAGDHASADADILAHPAMAVTPAGQARAIVRMDGAYLLGFGPRTAGAVRDLAARLYGDQLTR